MTAPATARIQLTLFVPDDIGALIEPIRRELDPVQAGLIPAHVTLCREDELARLADAEIGARLTNASVRPITLTFGPPQVFMGHGILLPSLDDDGRDDGRAAFQALRRAVLADPAARDHAPHITLAHPRNPRAPGNDPARAAAWWPNGPQRITFPVACLIRQEGTSPWRVLAQHPLGGD